MADRQAQRKLAKQVRSGSYAKSSVGAKARAAATRLKNLSSSPKAEPRADSPARGKHRKLSSDAQGRHALTDSLSTSKNARGSFDAPSRGKHSKTNPSSTIIRMSKKDVMTIRHNSRPQGAVNEKMNLASAMSNRRAQRNRSKGTY